MKHFNDHFRIEEARLPWTIWGSTTEYANFVHNSELRRLPMIRNSFVRHDLNREAALMGRCLGTVTSKQSGLPTCAQLIRLGTLTVRC